MSGVTAVGQVDKHKCEKALNLCCHLSDCLSGYRGEVGHSCWWKQGDVNCTCQLVPLWYSVQFVWMSGLCGLGKAAGNSLLSFVSQRWFRAQVGAHTKETEQVHHLWTLRDVYLCAAVVNATQYFRKVNICHPVWSSLSPVATSS